MAIGLFVRRDDPFDVRFGCDVPAEGDYACLGDIATPPDAALVEGERGHGLRLDGRDYAALDVASGEAPVRLPATDALADVTRVHAAAAGLAPDIVAAQPRCPRHRTPCAFCDAEERRAARSPRAHWFAERAGQPVSVCACEGEGCTCFLSAFLAARDAGAMAFVHIGMGVVAMFAALTSPPRDA